MHLFIVRRCILDSQVVLDFVRVSNCMYVCCEGCWLSSLTHPRDDICRNNTCVHLREIAGPLYQCSTILGDYYTHCTLYVIVRESSWTTNDLTQIDHEIWRGQRATTIRSIWCLGCLLAREVTWVRLRCDYKAPLLSLQG